MSNIRGPLLASLIGASIGGVFYLLFAKKPNTNHNKGVDHDETVTKPTNASTGGNNFPDSSVSVGSVAETPTTVDAVKPTENQPE